MNRKLLLAIAFLCLTNAACAQTAASPDPHAGVAPATGNGSIETQKAADIQRLMEVTGAGGLGVQLLHSLETDLRPLLENSLPPGEYRAKLVDLYLAKFRSKATEESLTALVMPIYDKHFTDDEIKQLTAFYQTPVGKKAVAELPKVVAESQQAGKQWGEKVGQESMSEVLAEHPDLRQALEDAQKNNYYPR